MQSILNNPKYGPKSELGETEYTQHSETLTEIDILYFMAFSVSGINMYTYLKFGLPRVMPPGLEEV